MRVASILIRNGTVVTMDQGRVIPDGAVLVEGSRIAEIGPAADLAGRSRAAREIDATGKIVLPGLIDAHYHTCQQFLRGVLASVGRQEHVRFPVWKNYLVPFESLLEPEDVYLSGLAAYTNMIKVGTTCVSEHGARHPREVARAMTEVGIRGLLAESTMDISDRDLPPNMVLSTEEAIARNVALVQEWSGTGDGLIRGCFSFRQIIACTPVLIREIARLAREYDALVQTHLAEGTYEVEYALTRHGLRPAEHLERLEALGPRLLAAHSVLLTDREVELYARHGVKVAHCPVGNFSGLGMTKLPLMRRLGIDVGLGSDGASGGSIDLFQAMHISLVGQLLHYGTPYLDRAAASTQDCVAMATIGGARAVRWEAAIGSLAVGKRADLIILDTSHPDAQSLRDDLYFAIVKCLRGRDVETVLVNGRILMESRRMLTVDEDGLRRRVEERIPRLYSRFREYLRAQGRA
jgi:5-methylthioadenosine/S-adenosylhomocysteine deaminase